MGLEPDIRRIRMELREIWVDPPAFYRPGASPVIDLLHWEVVIDGPDGTPYAGGTFPVDVHFTANYPLKPPKISFKTKVFHPNINWEGQMVLDIFDDKWSPALTIEKLLLSIVSVLYDPMLDRPINGDIARLYKTDSEMYEQMARAWTWEYSLAPIVSYYPTEEDERRLDYRAAAPSAARQRRIASLLPRGTLKRVVAFLQGWSVALPFATSRRRFFSTVLPLSNYTGRACF